MYTAYTIIIMDLVNQTTYCQNKLGAVLKNITQKRHCVPILWLQ